MAEGSFVECAFLIPIVRDANLADGEPQTFDVGNGSRTSFEKCSWGNSCPGFYEGFYRDPDTGERVADKSRKYVVAINEDNVHQLKRLLTELCGVFCQKCIYLNIAGRVEFIEADSTAQGDS